MAQRRNQQHTWPRPPQAQPLLMHASLSPHALPQAPQWSVLFARFTQVPAQAAWPEGHWQRPAAHDPPEAHTALHIPQLRRSVWRLVQTLPQRVCPVGHWHRPLTQVWPVGHAASQAPQWAPSVLGSTQAVPHMTRGDEQGALVHVVPLQTLPAAHTTPQPPQLVGLVKPTTSQPLSGLRSQSPEPAAQVKAHAPAVQVVVLLGRA